MAKKKKSIILSPQNDITMKKCHTAPQDDVSVKSGILPPQLSRSLSLSLSLPPFIAPSPSFIPASDQPGNKGP
jgi:hypothetical protein